MMKSDGRSMTPGLRRRWTRAPRSAEETSPDSPPARKPARERAAGTFSLLRLHRGGVATAGRELSPCAPGPQRIPCYLSNYTRLPAGFARAAWGRSRGGAAVRPGERRIQLRGSTVRPGKRFPRGHLLNLTRWSRHVRAPSMPSLIQAGLSSQYLSFRWAGEQSLRRFLGAAVSPGASSASQPAGIRAPYRRLPEEPPAARPRPWNTFCVFPPQNQIQFVPFGLHKNISKVPRRTIQKRASQPR
ncbi:uncharacterized protein LOC123330514 [Bubalus bubalis]|uniref:uncharacterized protein LOC123330514 n=1 Tax=Bubalus bubalis TaxID=89462 RepID=UPI001D12E4D5|nr:uncharacterized protein LOC123330514 [Bubalus bubalis]